MNGLPEQAFAAALAGLDAMNPARLASLLKRYEAAEAWAVAMGEYPDPATAGWFRRSPGLRDAWARSGRARTPESVWERCRRTETQVLVLGRPGYPEVLADDHEAPAVLFARGDLGALSGRRVGVVGTRNATEGGRRLAARFGRELADAGVTVVSGLARGIDGCVHAAVLAAGHAPPVAVVASGPDVPFPRAHAGLWSAVIEHGLLVSEHPPGAPPLAIWFPMRNRILAALSEVLVVVESRSRGGSLVTARQALDRQIPVLAVPGSLLNKAAEGTNRLIADGAVAVLDTLDVLVALGLETSRAAGHAPETRPRPNAEDSRLLEQFSGDALTLDQLVLRSGRSIIEVALGVGRLEAAGWLVNSGGWFEPVGARSGR